MRAAKVKRKIILRREKHGQHAVVFGLVNESRDEVAQANAIAEQINAVANFDFQNGELLAVAEPDAAELDGAMRRVGHGRGTVCGEAKTSVPGRISRRTSAANVCWSYCLRRMGLDLVARHGWSKDSDRMMSGVVSSGRGGGGNRGCVVLLSG